MPTQTLLNWFARQPSAARQLPQAPETAATPRERLRVGIPRVLNLWSTHQFWIGFFAALGIEKVVFSSDTSEEQGRAFGAGRGTVDCCYPVKCMSGHYGELIFGQKRKIDILFSPPIRNLPSFIVLAPQLPYAGGQVWASDFLPGCHQGTQVAPGPDPMPNIKRRQSALDLQEMELGLAQAFNRRHLACARGIGRRRLPCSFAGVSRLLVRRLPRRPVPLQSPGFRAPIARRSRTAAPGLPQRAASERSRP